MEGEKAVYPSVDPGAANYPINDSPPNYNLPSNSQPIAEPITADSPSVDREAAHHSANDSPPNYYPPSNTQQSYPTKATQGYSQQQPQTNVVVVTQPSEPRAVSRRYQSSDTESSAHSLALLVIALGMFCCLWALLCGIPALMFANKAKTAADEDDARQSKNISLCLSAFGLVFGVIGLGAGVGVVIWVYT